MVTGDKISELRLLSIGLPQGSTLASVLFNIYTADMPEITSKKSPYADNMNKPIKRTTTSFTEQLSSNDTVENVP